MTASRWGHIALVGLLLVPWTGCRHVVEPPPDRTDSDLDGIIDRFDGCPRKGEVYNGYRDDDGCPDNVPASAATHAIVIGDQIRIPRQIKFRSGADVILPESFDTLNEVVAILQGEARIKVQIEGYTDNQGKDLSNLSLSQRRADSVMKYLVKGGIEADRLKSVGNGKNKPVDTNDTPEGRNNNRRVEFHILKG